MAINYTVEEILSLAKDKGLTPPAWNKNWARLKTYNGWEHEQRVKGWQASKLAVRMKLIPPASELSCQICGATAPRQLQHHSENYSKLTEYVLCTNCHRTLHQRKRLPEKWCELVSKYASGGEWYETLA